MENVSATILRKPMGAMSVFTTGNYHCQLRSKQIMEATVCDYFLPKQKDYKTIVGGQKDVKQVVTHWLLP